MTGYGREILGQVVGGDGNITLLMQDAVTVAEQRIHRLGVRPIRSDEIEAALVEAGIEIPKEVSEVEEVTEDDDALKMPVAVDWAEIEHGTLVEFKDREGEIRLGLFANVSEDGNIVVTVDVGGESVNASVVPENVRLV